jgi:hypothetical protein
MLRSVLVVNHFPGVALLVSHGLFIPDLALLGGESLELLRDETGDISKGSFRIVSLDSRAGSNRVKEVRAHVTLGGIRVLKNETREQVRHMPDEK